MPATDAPENCVKLDAGKNSLLVNLAWAAMAEDRVERRLTAVLAADIAGYSRLMGADEDGTLAALKTLRREVADPKIKEHRGRIVNTTGGGLQRHPHTPRPPALRTQCRNQRRA